MKVALYARVSTTDKGQDPEAQLMPLREYCKRNNWDIYKEYVEQVSAVKTRPVFKQCMEDARLRYFDCIIVWTLDRFARSIQDFTNYVKELDRLGVRFICMTQSIDTDKQNPASRLLMHVLAAIAEFEHALIKERVKAGMARAKVRGVRWAGRPKVILNSDRVMELHRAGLSVREVAKKLGVSRGVVWLRLKRGLLEEV